MKKSPGLALFIKKNHASSKNTFQLEDIQLTKMLLARFNTNRLILTFIGHEFVASS